MANEKRLIDANALLGRIWVARNVPETLRNFADVFVASAPTVDAVEVVHGRWIKYKDEKFIGYDADGRIKYRNVYSYNCDKCGHGTAVKSNYCPACGAKMEGVKEVGY